MKISKFAQQQAEQEHIIKTALKMIDLITIGQFRTSKENIRDTVYDSTCPSYHFMMEQFKVAKTVLLQSDNNNKELVSKYIAKINETLHSNKRSFNLSRLVLILLGIQAQEAYDKQDEIAYQQYIKENEIWQDIIQRADDILKGGGTL
ncbi:hypothetical protein FKQ51_24545 [Bacillus toyonensis]|uniref:hypothetical protein n=1 Tax=Bacillus toyonensis TaxID=155322 RepID=UPI00270A2A46|nr:hypothetical protein [Bacillus toyonensis]MDO8160427.1 hypothetical protein [Bacillus toyonensis]